ncbi:Rne/Rng family ribonuclease [sulfur-oxidizing endosymbiont of Gigantopelta aegis]|uniref:Rne/Rng family ribonuclease n=1 Tax=sulfur-oxidizing endosymbiont of Gigantopelta aegis TaxID=2794934 RepID=UPI001FE7B71D|nr:Rne/Rng family ribonuclease [sulfur-oxidizing endosymbiont of Gigantopelta aegis]
MKRMLFNATQPEELRVALVDGQHLFNLDIETTQRTQKKANIYKARITRVEPSLEAAFVDYGSERHGFLPLKDISRQYFRKPVERGKRANIAELLQEGMEVVVQVDKEERGNKGAALTTFISLPGRYLVLMPNNPKAGGISRRIEGEERSELKDILSQLTVPESMGLIVRTAGIGKSIEELQLDLDYLLHLWTAIDNASAERKAPFLIYQESNIVIRAIRDYLRSDITEIIIDDENTYKEAYDFMQRVMPQNLHKVKLYSDNIPLFSRYQIESQIETAFQREVHLPSGGAIVIDHTEALISIDINSARATRGSDIEETALNTNLEAADEVARQLRLRDLGGLVVIDFIDMSPAKNQRAVENRMKDALKLDRARVQVGRISRFGLLEMSRQRLKPSLGESSQITCPRCSGHGTIRGIDSMGLSVLRILEEESTKDNTGRILAQLPVNVATFLLNDKRDIISEIESRQNITITLIPNESLVTPHYRIERIRNDENMTDKYQVNSYNFNRILDDDEANGLIAEPAKFEEPAVKAPTALQPQKVKQPLTLVRRIWTTLFNRSDADESDVSQAQPAQNSNRPAQDRSKERTSQSNRKQDSRKKNDNRGDKRKKPQKQNNKRDDYKNNQRNNNNNNRNTKPAVQTKDIAAQHSAQNIQSESPALFSTSDEKDTANDSAANQNSKKSSSQNKNRRKNTNQNKKPSPTKTQTENAAVESTNTPVSSEDSVNTQTSSDNSGIPEQKVENKVEQKVEQTATESSAQADNTETTNEAIDTTKTQSTKKKSLRGPGSRRTGRRTTSTRKKAIKKDTPNATDTNSAPVDAGLGSESKEPLAGHIESSTANKESSTGNKEPSADSKKPSSDAKKPTPIKEETASKPESAVPSETSSDSVDNKPATSAGTKSLVADKPSTVKKAPAKKKARRKSTVKKKAVSTAKSKQSKEESTTDAKPVAVEKEKTEKAPAPVVKEQATPEAKTSLTPEETTKPKKASGRRSRRSRTTTSSVGNTPSGSAKMVDKRDGRSSK